MSAPAIPDQVALVTGANAGMGQGCVRAFLEAGYRVVATDVVLDRVSVDLAEAVQSGRLLCLPMDVGDPLAVDRACSQVEQQWGRIDACVNNAGILQYANCEQTTARNFGTASCGSIWMACSM